MTDEFGRVHQRLDDLNSTIGEFLREFGELTARIGGVEKSYERLTHILIENNGRAIVPRVAVMEGDLKDTNIALERIGRELQKINTELERLDETKLSGDIVPPSKRPITGEFAAVEIERERTARTKWEALKPLGLALGGGIGGGGIVTLLLKALGIKIGGQ